MLEARAILRDTDEVTEVAEVLGWGHAAHLGLVSIKPVTSIWKGYVKHTHAAHMTGRALLLNTPAAAETAAGAARAARQRAATA